MNILFYGNCQLFAILKTLNLSTNYNIFHIECCKGDINQEYFTSIIQKCDVIVTQNISENYRNVEHLSTHYINQNKNPNCKIIIFDSCYFNFYYFDATYKKVNNEVLHQPISYHYNKMIECYCNGYTIEHYIDNFVNNLELKTSEELETIAENSLSDLHKRYVINKTKYTDNNVYIISTHDYIKLNYKEKLLFYSMNHPSKHVIQFICKEIIDILQIKNTINYEIDILNNPKCILYKCISKNVNFDINTHTALTSGITDINKIAQMYFDTYKTIGFT
jgi:hypothetical protein